MTGVISTGNHPAALWPGVHAFVMGKYNEHPMECTRIFDFSTSKQAYEEDVETTGFGMAKVKAQGSATEYDSHAQGFTKRYTHVAYSLGYIVTREENDDNLYKEKSFKRGEQLAFSFRTTKETVAANVLNRGFNASYVGGDGKALFAADHPTLAGDQSNVLPVAADLSESSLEDMLTQIMEAKNSRGLQIAIRGASLIVPPALAFTAERLMESNLRPGTDQNDINAIRNMGLLPKGYTVNHYLTDDDAWFIKTDAPHGLQGFTRKSYEFARDNDFDTGNAKAKGYERYALGWTDFRGAFGTPGAA